MDIIHLSEPDRIKKLPDKTVVLLSNGNHKEQGIAVTYVELRLYQENDKFNRGPYSIVTAFV